MTERKNTGKPAARSTGKPAARSTGKPAAKSTGKPAAKSTRKPASRTSRKTGRQEVKKRKNILYVITSRTAMLIMAALLVFSYLSSYLNPAHGWMLSIPGLCYIPLAILNLLLLIWALRRRSKSFLIPFIALLPSLFYIGRYVQVFTDSEQLEAVGDSRNIKLVTYNVGRFSTRTDKGVSKLQNADEIFDFLNTEKPDIVCLQEVWIQDIRRLKAYFNAEMPGYHFRYCLAKSRSGHFGNVTFSKFPIVDSGKITFDKSANMAIYTDVRSGDQVFRVYNCHFESYNISLPHIIKSLGKDHQKVLKETGDKLEASITRRPEQVDRVLKNIRSNNKASVVCGDFNDTPMSYTYNQLMKGRKDAFVEAGSGFGATYSFLWPALRIDYALLPDNYTVTGHEIQRIGYSDHYPVITYFLI